MSILVLLSYIFGILVYLNSYLKKNMIRISRRNKNLFCFTKSIENGLVLNLVPSFCNVALYDLPNLIYV